MSLGRFDPRPSAECFLLTSIVQLLTKCIFWTRPAETCLSAPKICSLEPWTEKGPDHLEPGQVKQSGTEWSVRPYPLCTHWLGRTLLSRSDPVQRFVRQRQRFVRRCQGRDPGHTGIRAGRGPLALRCGNKPHRRAERPSGRSDRGLRFVPSRQRFVR
jgi:hypothetical protein